MAAVAVVAVAAEARGPGVAGRAEPRAAAVVLEACEHARARSPRRDLDRDVADQPRAIARGPSRRRAARRPRSARSRVRTRARAADSRRRRRGSRLRGRQPRAVPRFVVASRSSAQSALVAVLPAADVEEVVAPAVELLAERRWRAARSRSRASGSAARATAGCRGRRRCSSGRGRARRRAASQRAPSTTTSFATCSSVSGTVISSTGSRPSARPPS